MYLWGVTKHFCLIDNLTFYNPVRGLILPAQGEDFSPWPNLETVCLPPPLWKALPETVQDRTEVVIGH